MSISGAVATFIRRTSLLFLIGVACGLVPTGDAARAQAPLAIEQRRDIKFGEFASDATVPGTVVLSANADAVTVTGPITNFGGNVRRARFRITGEPRAFVWVTLPTSITIRKGTSGNVMTVDSFTMDQQNPIRLNKNGRKTINVGATLRIDANQRRGNYNDDNDFTVSVAYD